jgi:hypothetical protein
MRTAPSSLRAAATVLVTLWLAVLAAGCTGAPDRREDATRLQDAVAGMPGVSDAYVSYENAVGRGATMSIHVQLPDATRQQIVDVVDRINAVRGDLFTKFDQSAEFGPVADGGASFEVRCGATLDAATVADEAVALRTLAARVQADSADWWCNPHDRRLSIRGSRTPIGDVLSALRATGSDVDGTSMEVVSTPVAPAGDLPISLFKVQFPYSADDFAQFKALVARLAATPWTAGVGPGSTIGGLSVRLQSPATAHRQLTDVIAAVGAGPHRPLQLAWALEDSPAYGADTPRFTGRVDVGGCNYGTPSEAELHPENYLTPAALTLQRQLRAKYDTCPK